MPAAQSILTQINSSNYTNGITTIYQPFSGCSGFVTTLRLTINLNSIEEANFPYIPDDTPPAVLQQILDEVALNTEFKEITLFFKKGNGAWLERCPMKIFNKEPFYDVNLMRLFSDANTIDIAEDFSLGIQVKPEYTLTETDKILVWGSVVEEKKNNGNEELAARLESLELALFGRLTNLPSNTLLGRNAETGNVEILPQSTFTKSADLANILNSSNNVLTLGNSITKAASSYGSMSLYGFNGTYSGIHFANASDTPHFIFSIVNKHHGVWSPSAAGGWHWLYNQGNFSVYSSAAASEGTYIGLNKGLGSLPGYPNNRYSVLATDDSNLYFSAGLKFSATMSANGIWTAMSDENEKIVIEPIGGEEVLEKINRLPIHRYHFKNEDSRIHRIGTFAQDFYREFKCGGTQEIDDDASPTNPSKMLAISDVAGVCLAGIKSLISEIEVIKDDIRSL